MKTIPDIIEMLEVCAEAAQKDGKVFRPVALVRLAGDLRETWKQHSNYLERLKEERNSSGVRERKRLRQLGFQIIHKDSLAAEAKFIERVVRDAIVGYQEAYASAPNDDCERELKERAELANQWLTTHGLTPETINWSKEATPCL